MINNRIRELVNSLILKNFIKNNSEFASSLNMSPQKLSEILRGKQKIQLEDLQLLIKNYSDVHPTQ